VKPATHLNLMSRSRHSGAMPPHPHTAWGLTRARNIAALDTYMLYRIALMMEAVSTSETSVHSNEITRRYILEDSKLHLKGNVTWETSDTTKF
jgi:hypothetical protein